MTGNEDAYFIALYKCFRLVFRGDECSAIHCRSRTRYGRLIVTGRIQRDRPSWVGRMSKLAPGRSMHIDSQMSPRTFAKEVKMSANITSEK